MLVWFYKCPALPTELKPRCMNRRIPGVHRTTKVFNRGLNPSWAREGSFSSPESLSVNRIAAFGACAICQVQGTRSMHMCPHMEATSNAEDDDMPPRPKGLPLLRPFSLLLARHRLRLHMLLARAAKASHTIWQRRSALFMDRLYTHLSPRQEALAGLLHLRRVLRNIALYRTWTFATKHLIRLTNRGRKGGVPRAIPWHQNAPSRLSSSGNAPVTGTFRGIPISESRRRSSSRNICRTCCTPRRTARAGTRGSS